MEASDWSSDVCFPISLCLMAELWFETERDFTEAYQTELGKAVAADSLAHVGRSDRLFVEENVLFNQD
jgi:hypothetical protein